MKTRVGNDGDTMHARFIIAIKYKTVRADDDTQDKRNDDDDDNMTEVIIIYHKTITQI